MKILIVKPSALGDIIQALPVLNGLRDHWPQAQIDWIINDQLLPLLEGHPSLNRLIPYPRKRWTSPWRFPEMQKWARDLQSQHYDLTLDMQGLMRSGLMTWASGAKRRIGLKSAREGAGFAYTETVNDSAKSAAQRYLQCLEYLGVPANPFAFRLKPQAPLPAPLDDGEPYFVVHPYSQWRTKVWPWRNYLTLFEMMPTTRFAIVGNGPWFPAGPRKNLPGPGQICDLRGQLTLPTLLSVLAGASAVVSTDSGPAHIAAALDRPTLVLFGPTDPAKTRPVGRHVTVLMHEMPCAPCLKRSCHRDLPMECMSRIGVGDVVGWLGLQRQSSVISTSLPTLGESPKVAKAQT